MLGQAGGDAPARAPLSVHPDIFDYYTGDADQSK